MDFLHRFYNAVSGWQMRWPWETALRKPYVTVSVWQIIGTVGKRHLEAFFEAALPGCQPVVGPFVPQPRSPAYQSTTVTFLVGNEFTHQDQAIKAVKRWSRSHDLRDDFGRASRINIGGTFHNLTVLKTSDSPSFDMVFVHGLGGHAFETFASEPEDHRDCKIWVRDFLPDRLDREGCTGRYMIFGYPSGALRPDPDDIPLTVQRAALKLLQQLMELRGRDCTRPIFFVCHSLGGLVTTQAILYLIQDTTSQDGVDDLREVLSPDGNCLVKGIAYFGTPFLGSTLANWLSWLRHVFVAARLPFNLSYLSVLRVHNSGIGKMVDDFRARTSEIGLPLLTFFEQKKVKGLGRRVVELESACGNFAANATPVGLMADHMMLVKFSSDGDRLFNQEVAGKLEDLVHANKARSFRCWDYDDGSGQASDADAHKNDVEAELEDRLRSRSAPLRNFNQETPWRDDSSLQKRLRELRRTVEESQSHSCAAYREVDQALSGTSEWILEHTKFKAWDDTQSGTLFVLAPVGYGKSVLAKFVLMQRFGIPSDVSWRGPPTVGHSEAENTGDARPIIALHFNRRGIAGNTFTAVLQSIISQIWQEEPDAVNDAILECLGTQASGRRYDIAFWWDVLRGAQSYLTRKLVCVIDGLDEILAQFRHSGQGTDERAVEYLQRLCDNQMSKVLIFTRPASEISRVYQQEERTLQVMPEDVEAGVKTMISIDMAQLAKDRHLSDKRKEELEDQLNNRCTHSFQMAKTILRILRTTDVNLQNQEATDERLSAIRVNELDYGYASALDGLSQHSIALAAWIIRLVFISPTYLSLLQIQDAYTVACDEGLIRNKPRNAQPSDVRHIFEHHLRPFLTISNDGDEDVHFCHQSAVEFFQSLKQQKWAIFRCNNTPEAHSEMALLCIGSLLLQSSAPTLSEKDQANERKLAEHVDALATHHPFIRSAVAQWVGHTRQAGSLMHTHCALLSRLLGLGNYERFAYLRMSFMTWRPYKSQFSVAKEWNSAPVENFLAQKNLHHIWELYPVRITSATQTLHNGGQASQGCPRPLQTQHQTDISRHCGPLRVSVHAHCQAESSSTCCLNIMTRCPLSGDTPLHSACRSGSLATAAFLIESGAPGNCGNNDERTPFMLALSTRHLDLARLLIREQQAFEIILHGQSSALHRAVECMAEDIVAVLLESGWNVNSRNALQWTPLHEAAKIDCPAITQMLLDWGADPYAVTVFNENPLHSAAHFNNCDFVERLFQKFPNFDHIIPSKSGRTALHQACITGNEEVYRILQRREVSFGTSSTTDDFGQWSLHLAAHAGSCAIVEDLKFSGQLFERDKMTRLPLHTAVEAGRLHVVKRLLQHMGAEYVDVKFTDTYPPEEDSEQWALTPLYLAVRRGRIEVLDSLLDLGADAHVKSPSSQTLLHVSARHAPAASWNRLCGLLDPLARDSEGKLPFHEAAYRGHDQVIAFYLDLLPDKNISVDEPDNNGNTPLHYGLWSSNRYRARIVKCLVEAGADVLRNDSNGDPPLYLAARRMNKEALLLLLRIRDIDINAQSREWGRTALHISLLQNWDKGIDALLTRRPDGNVQDKVGRTPAMLAAGLANESLLTKLSEIENLNLQLADKSGFTAFDYARASSPIQELFRRHASCRSALEKDVRPKLRQALREQIDQLCDGWECKEGRMSVDQESKLVEILHFLRLLRDWENARACLESGSVSGQLAKPFLRFRCSRCEKRDRRGPGWCCQECILDVYLCDECYENHRRHYATTGCSQDHIFLEYAGDSWYPQPLGIVKIRGQTFEAWIEGLRMTYAEEEDEESSMSTADEAAAQTHHAAQRAYALRFRTRPSARSVGPPPFQHAELEAEESDSEQFHEAPEEARVVLQVRYKSSDTQDADDKPGREVPPVSEV